MKALILFYQKNAIKDQSILTRARNQKLYAFVHYYEGYHCLNPHEDKGLMVFEEYLMNLKN